MMSPVSNFAGGAEERTGAGELNTSAGEGQVEMTFRTQTVKTVTALYNSRQSQTAVHTKHAEMRSVSHKLRAWGEQQHVRPCFQKQRQALQARFTSDTARVPIRAAIYLL